MGLLDFLQRRNIKNDVVKDNMQILNKRIARNREAVFEAVQAIGRPVNGLAIARHMHIDSASVTPRLSELVKRGRILVADRKPGLDGITRKLYVVNRKQER